METRGMLPLLKFFGAATFGCGSEFVGRSGENSSSVLDRNPSSGKSKYLESKKEGLFKVIQSDSYSGKLVVWLDVRNCNPPASPIFILSNNHLFPIVPRKERAEIGPLALL